MKKVEKKPIPSKKEIEIQSLPRELQEFYERIVADYKNCCILRYGRPFVSYPILADLIKLGWRPTNDPFIELESFKK